ncbi:branched-chain fatty-acid kinase [Acetoanaerobium sticklandii]|uniref:Probable butyrate kinase n=1 Tax=Acetoanaerobium sticklandii (strain ATCC 12662 / DSM 519 / JCM 1433 / CCUG 9281 / NCIMB 10654 / HF) TaxID=499177 RepID=E3PU77_ACESD|nr:butyrate kinase [Acetoanaerobium sticklandii]CBH20338.1 branched-chain fatty-acid kinase [Acetoanaerobium sticklandii]
MKYNILAINPGSTSTKLALYENDKEIFCNTLEHSAEEIEKYDKIQDQFEMRKNLVISSLLEKGYDIKSLSAVVGRGGMVPKVKSGAYKVNETMVDRLKFNPVIEHASNLGALIAYEIANEVNISAYIYDSVRVDELNDVARISGMPEISRTSTSHALNSRAMAMKVAKMNGKKYSDMNFVVAHLGGGISVSVHEKGRMVDILADDEGPFSPERAGRVPCKELIDLCYSGEFDKKTMNKKLRGNGGLKAYLNTVDVREVDEMIERNDEKAKLILEAMAYQVAKGIGDLSTVVEGKVDAIVLTGGIAYSKRITALIKKRVEFIAPVEIMPGENEMESLAMGILRVLKGEEEASEYSE